MRAGLPPRVNARPFVLDRRRGLLQRAIRLDRQRSDAAAVVVRDQCDAARLIDLHIAGPAAFRRLMVERAKLTRLAIERKRAHGAARLTVGIADLADRIEISTGM